MAGYRFQTEFVLQQAIGQAVRKIPVVFATSVFEEVHNGPALYANYLWQAFKDDPNLEFHLVAPEISTKHPRLHASGVEKKSRAIYMSMQEKALTVASDIKARCGSWPIVHGNAAHSMSLFRGYPGRFMVQVNDYDAARAFYEPMNNLKRFGFRRTLSLAWRNRQERSILNSADVAVCNSEFVKKEIQKRYSLKTDSNLKVVYKAIDSTSFNRKREETKSETKPQKQLLFLGSNWLGKGLDVLIEAITMLSNQNQVQLLVAGNAFGGEKKIKQMVESLGIVEQVKFLGHVDRPELPNLMHRSDLMVFPSRNEAFGVAVIEALAAGLPVVASRVGGIPEILGSAKHSRLVPSNDPQEFARAIDLLLVSNATRQEIQSEGEAIANRFSVSRMISDLKSLYPNLDSIDE